MTDTAGLPSIRVPLRHRPVPHWLVTSKSHLPFEPDVPSGLLYRPDFITDGEERELAARIAEIQFATFEMRGVAARRRVAFFGRSYDARSEPTPPIPAFLLPLQERVAQWANVEPAAFVMALVNEYPPGAPIGWHRDAPQYDLVAGVSLLSSCRMKFRPYDSPREVSRTHPARLRRATHELMLERRSAYLMTGLSRTDFEHHIPGVTALRYSITFRTARH